MNDGEILKREFIRRGLSIEDATSKMGKKNRMSIYGYFKTEFLTDKIKYELKKNLNIDIDEARDRIENPDLYKDQEENVDNQINNDIKSLEKRVRDLEIDVSLLKKFFSS